MIPPPPITTPFPYPTPFRSQVRGPVGDQAQEREEEDADHPADREDVAVGEVDQLDDAVDHRVAERDERVQGAVGDRKSTRLNSSHLVISYAVFCLKKNTVTT